MIVWLLYQGLAEAVVLDPEDREADLGSQARRQHHDVLEVDLPAVLVDEPEVEAPVLARLGPVARSPVDTVGVVGILVPVAGVVAEPAARARADATRVP